MVYVGGTDPGRWIPELLNETSGAEQHIIVTQNAFADGRYLDFMQTLYGERFSALTQEESKRAFDAYVSDAQKRWEHDQQFPDEPKQLRPGEKVEMTDGRFQVTGQVSVMDINERLLQILMEKNPDLSFAMEESFPFKSMFGSATPLGPIMELRVQDEQNALNSERASQAVDYWRTTSQQLLSDPDAANSRDVRFSYAKLVSSQAGLLLERGYVAEAEQAFRIANEFAPASPEAVFRYVNLLVQQSRFTDAIPVAANALTFEPENQQFRNLMEELRRLSRNSAAQGR
jgi:tetratricopeptide (TPR) repeat protein